MMMLICLDKAFVQIHTTNGNCNELLIIVDAISYCGHTVDDFIHNERKIIKIIKIK